MTTGTITPVGHKTLRLSDLRPEKAASFSPNLYRWMKLKGHFYRDGGVAAGVYRVKPGTHTAELFGEGTLMIGYPINGYPGDMDFAGVRLMSTLCEGGKAGSWCYVNMVPDLELVEGFWDRYLQVGRCAIDPDHHQHFMGDRYSTKDDVRTCLWCGAQHRRTLVQRVVYDEIWEIHQGA